MRAFSKAVNEAGQAAFRATLEALLNRIVPGNGGPRRIREEANGELIAEVRLVPAGSPRRWYLPFRPLIFGGDDFTFVSDGRLGLALLTKFMAEFKKEAANRRKKLGGHVVTASGGVAIVKAHYPFARAYSLAESLCHSAKQYKREIDEISKGIPCLDWHFAQAGLLGSLESIRRHHLEVPVDGATGRLYLRPVTLKSNPKHEPRAWPVIEKGIEGFRVGDWLGRRSKMKALMSALRGGKQAVKQFLTLYAEDGSLPDLGLQLQNFKEAGWMSVEKGAWRCGYYDALELVDWYISLG